MKTRRSFIKLSSSLVLSALLTEPESIFAKDLVKKGPDRKIYIFSKHLQWLDYEQIAQAVKQVGFDGIDLTVRAGGHVLPERVKNDLPEAVQMMKNSGMLADWMTTAITDPDDPVTIDILETASKVGINNYRMGWLRYDPKISIQKNIEQFNVKLKKFEKLNRDLGLKGAYQNHAGEMAGGPVWDIALMLDGVDLEYVGVRYDIRHATVEGGTSWPLGMKFLGDRINSFDIKDFIWKEIDGKWQPFNVPIGEGMVDFHRYFQIINELNISGDFTIHLEYALGGAESGKSELSCDSAVVISAMKHDLNKLKNLIHSDL